jgi:hypothetical protein
MKKIYSSLIVGSMIALGMNTANAQVDLAIGNIDAGYAFNETTGTIEDIFFTVVSNENGSASNISVAMYFVPVGATSMDDAILLETTTLPSISGNAARDVENWTINVNEVQANVPDGEYRLLAYVDYTKSISETDESNNSMFISTQGNNLKFTRSGGGPTGIAEKDMNVSHFAAYPNPVTTGVTVAFTLGNATHGSLKITDISGKEVMSVVPDNTLFSSGKHERELSVERLNAGLYFLTLQTQEGSSTFKLIKQ